MPSHPSSRLRRRARDLSVVVLSSVALGLISGGCGDGEADAPAPSPPMSTGPGGGDPGGHGGAPPACVFELLEPPLEPAAHVPPCFPVEYATNPPASGTHYFDWAAYRTYEKPVPRGYYVHNLEHGGIVVAHNCEGGCPEELAELGALLAGMPADPSCDPSVRNRFLVTPDPLLDVRFAVIAWGKILKTDCLPLDAVRRFVEANYAKAPEDTCTDGTDVSALPEGCGELPEPGLP